MADKKISALTAAATPLAGTEVLPIVQSGSTVKVSVSDLTTGRTVALRNANLTGGAAVINIGATADNTYHYLRTIDNDGQAFYVGNDDATGSFFSAGAYGRVIYSEGAKPLKVFVNGAYRAEYDTSGNYKLDTGNVVIGTAAKGIDFSANTHAAGMTSELLNDYEEGTFTPVLSSSGTPPTVTSYLTQYGSYTKIGNRVLATVSIRANLTNAGTGHPIVTGLPYAPNSNCFNGPTFGLAALLTIGGVQQNFISGTSVLLVNCLYNITTDYLCFSIMYEV
jgi:hypothetical protein